MTKVPEDHFTDTVEDAALYELRRGQSDDDDPTERPDPADREGMFTGTTTKPALNADQDNEAPKDLS